MSFGGNQSTPVSETITNDGFYPDLDLAHFKTSFGIEERHNNDEIKRLLVGAMVKINKALAEQKVIWLAAGFTSLEQTQIETIDGINLTVWHYQNAVFNQAKADFINVLIGTSRREPGANLADDAEELKATHLKEAAEAIAALNGDQGAFRVALL